MVVLRVKKNDQLLFCYKTSVQENVAVVVNELVKIHNLILTIRRLENACADLVEYGPLKHPSLHGYSEEQLLAMAESSDPKESKKESVPKILVKKDNGIEVLLNPDPTGRRIGEAPTEDYAAILKKTVQEATQIVSKDQINSGREFRAQELEDAIQLVKGAVTIVYPMGLPAWDPAQEIFDGTEDLKGTAESKEVLEEKGTSIWLGSKEMDAKKILQDYVGKNEKTKIIVKLQKKGHGPPVREPPIDEKTQREMMAYYYRKQEVHKKLDEDNETDYLNSPWADPKRLKGQFAGISGIKYRAF